MQEWKSSGNKVAQGRSEKGEESVLEGKSRGEKGRRDMGPGIREREAQLVDRHKPMAALIPSPGTEAQRCGGSSGWGAESCPACVQIHVCLCCRSPLKSLTTAQSVYLETARYNSILGRRSLRLDGGKRRQALLCHDGR